MKCPKCNNTNHSTIKMITTTQWGHGDCTYSTKFVCEKCGYETKPIEDYGLFPNNQEWRKCQKEFNK